MPKNIVSEFIELELEDLEGFNYIIDLENDYIYVVFTKILAKDCDKELMFKIINNKLHYHSLTYGWKIINSLSNNKYFWIDLLN